MIDWERFNRQVMLPEIGPRGMERIAAARPTLAGDPSIIGIAEDYLRAAGCAATPRRFDPSLPFSVGESRLPKRTIRVHALREDAVLASAAAPPSPLASQTDLKRAGLLLAIETLRSIVDDDA